MSILIVDDNPVNIILMEKILENAGYRDCVKAASVKEMFDIFDKDLAVPTNNSIDLILMDMMMPEIDGIEACQRLQQIESLKDIPIIIVTALGDSNKLAEALDAGAIDYVMKPINKIELLARIRVALRLKQELDWHKEWDKKIRNELDLAKHVQRSVLSSPIDDEKIEICAHYQPTFELAGDLYSWYQIDEQRYGVILLDMMGHGISSSLVCMFISSFLQETIKRIVDPVGVIKRLNYYMTQLYNKDQLIHYYFTAIYFVIDTEKNTIEYVNAGHPPGVVFLDGEKSVLMDQGCCAIGFFDQIEITKAVISYHESAKIILFTDGLMETIEEAGHDTIEHLLGKLEANKKLNYPDLIQLLLPEEENYHQKDDMCLVMVTTKSSMNET